MGLDDYIRQQLDPTKIDDKACEKAVEPLDTLKMSSEHFMGQFFEDIKFFLQMQMASGNADDMKMRFGVDLPNDKKALSKDNPYQQNGLPNLGALAKRDSIRCMAELQQAKLMRAALSERQLQEVMVDFWSNHFNVDMQERLPGADRRTTATSSVRMPWGSFTTCCRPSRTARRCWRTLTTMRTPSPANAGRSRPSSLSGTSATSSATASKGRSPIRRARTKTTAASSGTAHPRCGRRLYPERRPGSRPLF